MTSGGFRVAVPIPVCDTTGLVNLCGKGALITNGDWFTLQVSNLVWFVVLLALLVLAAIVPFPAREVDYTGYEDAEE
jgi:hypothetical protein